MRRLLSSPTFDNAEATRIAGLLHVILLTAVFGLLAYTLLILLLAQSNRERVLIGAALLPLMLIYLHWVHQGHVGRAARFFVLTLWLAVTLWTVFVQGLSNSAYLTYMFIIMVAAFTTSWRFVVLSTGLSLGVVVLVGIIQQQGALPPKPLAVNPLNSWITASIVLIGSVILIYRTISNITTALEEAHQSTQDLRKLNRAYRVLSQSNHILVRATARDSLLNEICRVLVEDGSYPLAWIDLLTGDSTITTLAGGTLDDVAAARDCIRPAESARQIVHPAQNAAYESIISLNLEHEAEHLGTLNVCAADAFDDSEALLLEELARDVAFGITTLEARTRQQEMEQRLAYQAGLLDQINDAIISTDEDRLIQTWNTAAEKRYGLPASEAIGRNLNDVYRTEYPQESREQVYQAIEENGFWQGELQQILPDGRCLHVYISLSTIMDMQGQISGIVSTSTDITERKRIQEALQLSQERLKRFLEASPDGIFICDTDFKMLEINTALLTMEGSTREAVIGRSLLDMAPFLKDSPHIEAFMQVMETGLPYEVTERARSPEAADRLLDIKAIKVGDGLGVILSDVTELRQLEHERERFFALSADMLVVIGLDGSFHRVNPSFEAVLGYSMDELAGMTTLDLMHPDERDEAIVVLGRLTEGEAVIGLEVRFRRKDDEYLWLNWNAVPYLEENEIFAVARDVTEMRQAHQTLLDNERLEAELQKERELNELKNWFMSLVSHEFRTPMTIIQSSAEIIRRYWDKMSDDVRARHLSHIVSQVAQLNALLSDYTLVLHAQAGRLEFQPLPQDVMNFCQQVMDDFSLTANSRHKLSLVCPKTPLTVMIDPRFLGYTLRNLLSNAIKYSPDGGEIRLELSVQDKQLAFQVSDQGIGIPAKALANIFEPYHRADNVGTIHGSGIGLNIVRQCVEAHGGQISVRSQEGLGSTFTVTLPLVASVEVDSV